EDRVVPPRGSGRSRRRAQRRRGRPGRVGDRRTEVTREEHEAIVRQLVQTRFREIQMERAAATTTPVTQPLAYAQPAPAAPAPQPVAPAPAPLPVGTVRVGRQGPQLTPKDFPTAAHAAAPVLASPT